MSRLFIALFVLLLNTGLIAQSAQEKAILGTYFAPKKDAKIEIYQKGGRYHGKFTWLEIGDKDINNPDPKLRSRELLGMTFISNFRYEDEEYVDGKIYDPQTGDTYDCIMWLEGTDLKVRGYMGFSMFGRTETFTRVKS
tara:strand:+ start:937 stop:1353 length:417 start_codon:yes stop_codon:yes gene_type:complete